MARAKRRRTRYVNVRLSDEEYEALRTKAQTARMSVSQLLRDHLGRLRITPRTYRLETLSAIAAVASNLRDVALWANRHKAGIEAVAVCLQLCRIEERLQEIQDAMLGKGELEIAS